MRAATYILLGFLLGIVTSGVFFIGIALVVNHTGPVDL
jgi:hypothetical protein